MDANNEYARWLGSGAIDAETRNELEAIKGKSDEIISRFSSAMSFGTAGLRSVMGAGTARMNIYTVAQATAGVAEVVNSACPDGSGKVAVAYDCRINSRAFAETAASVLAYHGIKVYFFESLRPTPELSFAVLYLECTAGINVTASHNPKEYNGYKVYWSDGAQLPPEHAATVSAAMAQSDVLDVAKADFAECVADGRIVIIGEEIDREYLKNVLEQRINPDIIRQYGDRLSLVYTPLHGTGYRLVPEALRLSGISNLRVIAEQAVTDGSFPTVKSPNPENSECFALAMRLIKDEKLPTDIIVATDPDGDRLGVAVKQPDGNFVPLNGNQIGALLVDYIIKARKTAGKLPANACAVRSAVSSELFDKICVSGGVTPVTVLTGFKYIGEKIKEYAETGEHTFIFGYEESQGFLTGGYVRDKDGVSAALLVAEAASYYKSKGMSLSDALEAIYKEFGCHREQTVSVSFGGALPMEQMAAKMASLRGGSITVIGGSRVTAHADYLSGIKTDLVTSEKSSTGLPSSDMLYWKTECGTTVIIRPSGTEPKVKTYLLACGNSISEAEERVAAAKRDMLSLFN